MEIPKDLSPLVKKALFRLGMGDLTEGEMLFYLTDPHRKNTGFPEDLAERAVALLAQEGFLDDKRVLRLVLRKTDERLLGPRRIREELVRRRFSESYIAAAMRRKVDYTARAKERLLSDPSLFRLCQTPAGRKKLSDRLVRAGFDYAAARSALEQVAGEDDFS